MSDPPLVAGGQGRPTVVALPAEIDSVNAGQLGEQLGSAFTPGITTTVVADMTGTTFCDSSGIRMLVLAHKQAADNNTELRLAVSSDAVLRVLALVELDHVLATYPSLGAAMMAEAAPGDEPPVKRPWPASLLFPRRRPDPCEWLPGLGLA